MAVKNMRVPLGKNKYLVSDGMAYWIVRTQHSKQTDKDYDVRLSGYCTTIEYLFESYFDREVMSSEAQSVEELGKVIKKTREEIRGWYRKVREASE